MTAPAGRLPWYKRTLRWGQLNLTEIDPARIDIPWWRDYWKRTRIQGVIINAGGIVAYYPSALPQHRAETLGERDLLGELCAAAREDGLSVVARIDSNRVREPFYQLHPDWCAVDAEGRPLRVGEFYLTCVHGPYYEEYIPAVLREIIARVKPDGFADNSWSGLGREVICYCANCRKKFKPLPTRKDWKDAAYLAWLQKNKARRTELWDLNNRVCAEAGGPDCVWAGMARGSVLGQAAGFRDLKALAERSKIVFLDHQGRDDASGFLANGESGKLWNELLGWETVVAESMAMYQIIPPAFRLASRPEPEARLWMLEGIAAGIHPWWHHIGSVHTDRRQFQKAAPVFEWHEKNQAYLTQRRPVAKLALLWSQENLEAYGQDEAGALVAEPLRGWAQALSRYRIPFRLVHIDQLAALSAELEAVVLPNLAALSEAQVQTLREFVASGKALIATGESSRFDLDGSARPDFALADILGAHAQGPGRTLPQPISPDWDSPGQHSYFSLPAEARGSRSNLLKGLEGTDLLAFGGLLTDVKAADKAGEYILRLLPPFPVFPPESAYPRPSELTGTPGLYLNEKAGGRVAYLPADLDRCYARLRLPDQGRFLANLAHWALKDQLPLEVEGAGFVDCQLYAQGSRRILHLVNLASGVETPAWEWVELGPFTVRLRVEGRPWQRVFSLISGKALDLTAGDGWVNVNIDKIVDHDVLVFE